jgi:6-phosphogluconolactonase
MDPAILIFETPLEAAVACGDRTLEILDQARKIRGRATLAVSGGSTPRLMFEAMAKRGFDWSGIEIFQVDERCVPPDSPLNNFRMIRESLLNAIRIDEAQVHRIRGELPPDEAAQIYEEEIRRSFRLSADELPAFDVIQRGL